MAEPLRVIKVQRVWSEQCAVAGNPFFLKPLDIQGDGLLVRVDTGVKIWLPPDMSLRVECIQDCLVPLGTKVLTDKTLVIYCLLAIEDFSARKFLIGQPVFRVYILKRTLCDRLHFTEMNATKKRVIYGALTDASSFKVSSPEPRSSADSGDSEVTQ